MTEKPRRFSRGHIAVMTRAPVEGRVKTRLAAAVGSAQALRVHQELLDHTLAEATGAELAPVSLWVDGDVSNPEIRRLVRKYAVPVHSQCGADLGERMAYVFDRVLAHADFCVVVGSDCPPLDGSHLRGSCEALDAGRDLVIGPAEDGGYVLIGLRAPHPVLFKAMPWGGDQVAKRTLAVAQGLALDCEILAVLWDLDRAEDLRRYRQLGSPITGAAGGF